jgi:hypothetical protein
MKGVFHMKHTENNAFEMALKLEELLNKMECAVLGITDGEGETANVELERG